MGVGGMSQTRLLSGGAGGDRQGSELLLWVAHAAASAEAPRRRGVRTRRGTSSEGLV